MTFLYPAMIIAGVAAIAWGLSASHRLRAPWDTVAAGAVLAGLVTALLGVLLVMVPHFFQG